MEDLGISSLLSKEGEDNKSSISSINGLQKLLQRPSVLALPKGGK